MNGRAQARDARKTRLERRDLISDRHHRLLPPAASIPSYAWMAPCRRGGDRHRRQRQHVGGAGGAAGRAGRVRRAARRGVGGVHAHHALGFALGGVLLGRLSDRFGIMAPVVLGAVAIGLGFVAAGLSGSLWQFALSYALIGFGTGDVRADDGGSVAVVHAPARHCGRDRLLGQLCRRHHLAAGGRALHCPRRLARDPHGHRRRSASSPCCRWRSALRRPTPTHALDQRSSASASGDAEASIGLSPNALQALLGVAGLACCVAMSMPQVHLVAYCADLGYGPARGAEMLSAMLGFGIFSRLGAGMIADRIGGVATLLMGSTLQGVALGLLYFLSSTASPRSTSSRRCSACSRAASCRSYADHRARVFPLTRGRHPHRPRHHGDRHRHGARRLDVGRAIFDHDSGSYRAAFERTGSDGICST